MHLIDRHTDWVSLEAALRADLDSWKSNPGADAQAEFEAITHSLVSAHSGSQRLQLLEKRIGAAQVLACKVCTIARAADTQLLAKPRQYSNTFLRLVQNATEVESGLDQLLLFHRRGRDVLQRVHAARALYWQTMY